MHWTVLMKMGLFYATDPMYVWIVPGPVVALSTFCLVMAACWSAWPHDHQVAEDEEEKEWVALMLTRHIVA
jgi:hypothetical protein